jgi:hypothetical protein
MTAKRLVLVIALIALAVAAAGGTAGLGDQEEDLLGQFVHDVGHRLNGTVRVVKTDCTPAERSERCLIVYDYSRNVNDAPTDRRSAVVVMSKDPSGRTVWAVK